MAFVTRFIAKVILNGLALWIAKIYFPGFAIDNALSTLAIGAIVLALLNSFLRPVLKLVATPLIWITFGLFNIIISMLILWIADAMLVSLSISNLSTLFWTSLIIAIANSIA